VKVVSLLDNNMASPIHYWGRSIKPTSFAEQHLYYCDCVGRSLNNNLRVINRDFYPYYFIAYVVEGCFIVKQYGRTIKIHAGESVLICMFDPHIFYVDKIVRTIYEFFHFNGAHVDDFISQITNHVELPYVYKSSHLPEIVKKIEFTYGVSTPRLDEPRMSAYIYEAICDIYYSLFSLSIETTLSSKLDFFNKIDEYIYSNLNRKITLDELCTLSFYSKYYFLRIFKTRTNMTPHQYVLKKKIEKAKYLLLYTGKKATEVASETGFADQNHFIKVFKRIEGCTPFEYLKGSH
jgi:AraC-like DNA-binding protein